MSTAPLGSIDTSVVIPAAVRAAAARADALQLDHKQRMGLVDQQTQDPAQQPPPPPPPEQQAQPPAPPEQQAPPAPPEQQAQPPQNQQHDPNADVADDQNAAYEHRYRSMKGRHDALKARTDRNTQGLLSRINELEAELDAARRAGPQSQPQVPAPSNVAPGFTEEDEATWGTDMLSLIDRVAERKVAGMRGELAQVAGQFTRKQMFDYLDSNLPKWRDTNEDPEFLAWLNLRDEGTGVIRDVLLKDAFAKGEPQRVAYFFRSFISDGALPAPSAGQPNGQTPPTQSAPSNRLDLASLAAPGRAGSSPPPPASDAKRMYATTEISRFFSDKARGMWRGREAEADALERDIFLAQTEGRVVSG